MTISEANGGHEAVRHIAICGSGLAAHMTAAALSHQLPSSIQITLVDVGDTSGTDLFYGTVAGPTAYEFNLSAGLSEPALVLESDTAFSWGTEYHHWSGGSQSWIQCYQLPLPVIDGVPFHHYLTQQNVAQLELYLTSAAAARKGAFAHPPRQPGQAPSGGQYLFSRAEYGYQFDPPAYARNFKASTVTDRVRQVNAELADVEIGERGISAIHLSEGQIVEADLYVDCTGPRAVLLSRVGAAFSGNRQLRAVMDESAVSQLGPPMRTVAPADYGWRAQTPLRGRLTRLAVFDPEAELAALSALGKNPERTGEATLGRRGEAWSGNCVGVGHASCVVEPLTPAPMMLLERDIQRLASLIPFSMDMTVERREFNRRSAEDHEHVELFTRALFETEGLPDTPYWRAARAVPMNEKLARKIELFQARGLLAAYDLEPFNAEDWTILHMGMGRRPVRHDRTADRAPAARVREFLSNMQRDIKAVVDRLPSHATYMVELQRYLLRTKR